MAATNGTSVASAPLRGSSAPTASRVHPPKRLIVCCDGIWNAPDIDGKALTNVAKITRCISDVDEWKETDPNKPERPTYSQIVHYQPGVGVGTGWFSTIWDGMTGRGLSKSIREAYSFICLNWSRETDQIVLIGFSRGAFTVRYVAEFMDTVGLLTKSGLRHLPRLFKAWKRLKKQEVVEPKSQEFQDLETRCKTLVEWEELRQGVRIDACAVWDTVSAIGFPMLAHIPQVPRRRYRTVGRKVPRNVKFAVQALALDETRRHFKPMMWDQDQTQHPEPGFAPTQCWFAGNHSDVGGGNKDMTLANVCLAWMIGQLTDKIQFDHDNLWAITTTRIWSKPSPSDDLNGESPPGSKRKIRVEAKAPISQELLQIQESWMSYFQERLGGSQIRPPMAGSVHYSVPIFDYLGIAEYRSKFPGCDEATSQNSFLLSKVVPPLIDKNGFEGKILEKWAEHILCAHVYIRQSRNTKEMNALDPAEALYWAPLDENLLDLATYEATVPVAAILSAFHRISKEYGRLKLQDERREYAPWNEIRQQREAQEQSRKLWQKIISPSTKPKAAFTFTAIQDESSSGNSAAVPDPAPSSELTVDGDPEHPVLTFTRDFPLLMGRPHDMPEPGDVTSKSTLARIMGMKKKETPYEVRSCKRCALIWPGEGPSIGVGNSGTSVSQTGNLTIVV